MKDPPIFRHVERHLGVIDPKVGIWGWDRVDGTLLQVVAFRDQPEPGATTLCTLGLGHHELCSTRGHVRQELVLACWDEFVTDKLAGLVPIVAEDVLVPHVALNVGQVLGSAGPLIPGSGLEALLCLKPELHPPSFAVCPETDPVTEFVWLVPITPGEAEEFCEGRGESQLARWQRRGVDLLDWMR